MILINLLNTLINHYEKKYYGSESNHYSIAELLNNMAEIYKI